LPAAQTLLNHLSLLVLTCAFQGATLRSYLTLKEPRLSRLAPAIPDSEVDHDRSHRYLHRPTGKSEGISQAAQRTAFAAGSSAARLRRQHRSSRPEYRPVQLHDSLEGPHRRRSV